MGVVLAELILLINRCSKQEQTEYQIKDVFMFPGSSCFPHSPCKEMREDKNCDANIVSKHDQLLKILNFLGK